ncbi:MAG: prepilin-type N-terminal cleavage/methylation domain-containing protein, partial [Planctomycetota bacterium]
MSTSAHADRAPKGFTLVELMVVVVIIGILMGLLGTAFVAVRTAARITVIKTEISQLETALENYKNEYSAYPPSFDNINVVAERGGDAVLERAGRAAVESHLRKAFPRYVPRGDVATPANTPWPFDKFAYDVREAYRDPITGLVTIDPVRFDAASALVFWLGGLPETAAASGQWIPAGFHADPTFPFKPGLPRKAPMFTGFEPERIVVEEPHVDPLDASLSISRYLRFYPDRVKAPYVYFKSHRVNGRWEYRAYDSTAGGLVQYAYQHAIVGEP